MEKYILYTVMVLFVSLKKCAKIAYFIQKAINIEHGAGKIKEHGISPISLTTLR